MLCCSSIGLEFGDFVNTRLTDAYRPKPWKRARHLCRLSRALALPACLYHGLRFACPEPLFLGSSGLASPDCLLSGWHCGLLGGIMTRVAAKGLRSG
jgi:hypothetical protein